MGRKGCETLRSDLVQDPLPSRFFSSHFCSSWLQRMLPGKTSRVTGSTGAVLEDVSIELLVGKEDKDDEDKLEHEDVAEADVETESVVGSARAELVEGGGPLKRGLEDLPVTAPRLPRVIAGPWNRPPASGNSHSALFA